MPINPRHVAEYRFHVRNFSFTLPRLGKNFREAGEDGVTPLATRYVWLRARKRNCMAPELGEGANRGTRKSESDFSWFAGGGFGGDIDFALR